jgi:Protein of unknown function DUF262
MPKSAQSTVEESENLSTIQADESGLETDQNRGAEIEVPFDPSKIDIIVKPMTISSLQDRLENNELDLTPDFQRQANVWDAKRKSRLIESILLRIPLPSFYFSEDDKGIYAVVDGLQRLCAVFHFIKCKELNRVTGADLKVLQLVGLQYLKELEGAAFEDLDRKFQRRIAELEITANIIRANTPLAVKFNVFARLNQGGMPLNAQEIRNAIFPGVWRRHVRLMAESKNFLEVTKRKVRTERQQDIEIVLRYVALWQLGDPYMRPTNQTLDEFLNSVVQSELSRWSTSRWDAAQISFNRAITAAESIFGSHVFRKSSRDENLTPINRGLFEAQLISLSSLSESELDIAIRRKEVVISLFAKALKENENFQRALLYGTGSAEASLTRIQEMQAILKGAIND